MNSADLEAMLAADLADRATRLILADALTDLGREQEALLCRDLTRPIRAANFGTPCEEESPRGRLVVDFDHTWIEWLPDDTQVVRHVRGPWEVSILEPKGRRSETRFMLWFRAEEGRPRRSRAGWETSVLYVRAPFTMTEAHELLFRDTVREHAVGCMRSDSRMWAIQWSDGIIEQEPQGLGLVQPRGQGDARFALPAEGLPGSVPPR